MAYHLPATRLLIEGWNPVFAPTPEALAATTGVDPWELRQCHVLFMSKAVWVFNAVAYAFTRAPFGLLVPLWPFLFVAACGQLWRLLRAMPWGVRLVGMALLWACAPGCTLIVDAVVCFGGVGLLAAMARRLAGERGTALPMVCLSFWMMTAKQTGLLTCFVFWACFAGALLWRERGAAVARLAGFGGVLMALFLVTCASPYFTSWVHYGHPLYPAYTVDEARAPVRDITADFRICDEDARTMGHVGSFVNTYLCPPLTRAYYNWKLGRDDFAPHRYIWWQTYRGKDEALSPLTVRDRLVLLSLFAAVALLGGRRLRFVWMVMAAGLFCFPTAYLGFSRYTPWQEGLYPLAACSALAWAALWLRGWKWGLAWGVAGAMMFPGVAKEVLQRAVSLDQTAAAKAILRETPPKTVGACLYAGELAQRFANGGHPVDVMVVGRLESVPLGNVRLLTRQVAPLRGAEVWAVPLLEAAAYPAFPNGEFRMGKGFELARFSEHARIVANPNRKTRLFAYPAFLLRAYALTLPRLLWARICGA